MPKKDRYIVGLDIGTTKVCILVAEIREDGALDIIGMGSCDSKGLRKGVIVNVDPTVECIKKVVEEAELMAGVNKAGIEVADTVLEQLASSEAVLTHDEKDLGVALIDIGGGTSDLAVFEKQSLWHSFIRSIGGDHFTSDIAVGLRTPIGEAEKI